MVESGNRLIRKIRGDDYQAFEDLFEQYYGSLCNFASKYFNDSFIAEDVVQDVFIKIWEDRKKINIRGSVKSYLYSAVRNKCLNKIESESVRKKYSEQALGKQNFIVSRNELEEEEFRYHLFLCIDKLPPRCKEVFLNSRFEEMKQEQISAQLNISIKTVKAQIGKALKLIRDCLQPSYPEFL